VLLTFKLFPRPAEYPKINVESAINFLMPFLGRGGDPYKDFRLSRLGTETMIW
jgi:hypothetical protein